jgi:hypothetical protein
MLFATARELVERNGIGETADALWRALKTEHRKLFPTTASSNRDPASGDPWDIPSETYFSPACLVEEAIHPSTIVSPGQRPEALLGRRRRARPVVPEQASLFSLS